MGPVQKAMVGSTVVIMKSRESIRMMESHMRSDSTLFHVVALCVAAQYPRVHLWWKASALTKRTKHKIGVFNVSRMIWCVGVPM